MVSNKDYKIHHLSSENINTADMIDGF